MTKISYPLMGDYGVPIYFLLSHVLKRPIIEPRTITSRTIELGFKYSPEFVCTPFKYTLGTMLESIEDGADTLIQMGGGCRYGYYSELQAQILKDLGYNVKLINLVTKGKANFKVIMKKLKQINPKIRLFRLLYYGFITMKMVKYMDDIDHYIRDNIGFEIEKGKFEDLKQKMLNEFKRVNTYRQLKKTYNFYLSEIYKVKVRKPDRPLKIGIIGELYTIMEPYSNYFLEKELAKNNIEIKRFTNVYYLLLEKKRETKKYLKYVNKYVKYSMGADAMDNIARTKYLCENNYDGIIHIKSSFCTPEIGAMPIISKIADQYNVPIIFFSFDANTSEVGIKTRLEAFYDMLEMRRGI